MSVAATAVLACGGCYIEARAHGQLVPITAGTAVSGSVLDGTVSAGLDLAIDEPTPRRVRVGVGEEHVIAAGGASSIDHAQAPQLEFGFEDMWSTTLVDAHFALAGFVPAAGNVSEMQLAVAAAFGTPNAKLIVGPSIGYWDAARQGIAVGIGADLGVRLSADPRRLLNR